MCNILYLNQERFVGERKACAVESLHHMQQLMSGLTVEVSAVPVIIVVPPPSGIPVRAP
jgi:hypothetical protein